MTGPTFLLLSTILGLATAKYACHDPYVLYSLDLGFPNRTYADTYQSSFGGPLGTQFNSSDKFLYTPWYFTSCSNLESHPFPPGFHPKNTTTSDPLNYWYAFGQIQPPDSVGEPSESCVSLGSPRHVNGTGTVHDLVLVETCADVEQWRTTFLFEDHDHDGGRTRYNVYLAGANGTWVLGNGEHRLVELVTEYIGSKERAINLAYGWFEEQHDYS